MQNVLLTIILVAVVAGLGLMSAVLVQVKRQGGFQQAVVETSDGKWPFGRSLFVSALVCFGVAMLVQLYTFFD